MRSQRPTAAALAVLVALASLPLALGPASAAPPVLSPVLELPPWAVGFFWTYHYEGTDSQSFAGFTATSLNDTYTSSIIGEESTARGDAWIVRNSHAGSMSGFAPVGPVSVPATATFTSLTYSNIRKSDLATLNFTQDLDITANVQILGNIHALAHNETYAEPPLADVPVGGATDGTPWHVYSNLTSQGWYQITPAPRQNVSSYLVFDYNLSVRGTETITVPAGTFDAYNLSGFGTMDFNGTLYSYAADYLWSPTAQARVRDEAGFLLTSHFVNRAPRWIGTEPFVRVDAGGYNDSLNLGSLVEDPEGSAISFAACTADTPLTCTVSPTGLLNVSSPTGVNATLNVTVTVTDGLPGGNFSARVRVLVRGPGNPNQPPVYAGPAELLMDEDTDYFGRVSDLFDDPEGDPLTIMITLAPPLFMVSQNDTQFHMRPPPNYYGVSGWTAAAYDTAGNYVIGASGVRVRAVNDVPQVYPVSPTILDLHADQAVNLTADFTDPDDGPTTYTMSWEVDGEPAFSSTSVWTFEYRPTNADAGSHTINVTVDDQFAVGGPVTFSVLVWGGPTITGVSPAEPSFRVVNGTSKLMGVNASDPDTELISYRWWLDGHVIVSGPPAQQYLMTFDSPGAHNVSVDVFDNGSSVSHYWNVTSVQLPDHPAGIDAPVDGSEVFTNQTVQLVAFADAGFTNLSFEWSLDGVLFDTGSASETGMLAAGVHNVSLKVTGLYNLTIAYNATFFAHVTSIAPAPPGGNNGNGTGNNTAPPQGDSSLLYIVAALVAAAAVGVFVVMRSRRKSPPGPGEPPAV